MDMRIDTAAIAAELITRFGEPVVLRRLDAESPTLSDIGYDSLSIVELVMETEAKAAEFGYTHDLDDDIWNLNSLVTNVRDEVQALLEGRDIG